MKALTVQQPWAWAIFNGKTVENRTQLWKHRGPLAIHAGARWSDHGETSHLVREAFREVMPNFNGGRLPEWMFSVAAEVAGTAMGAIIGTVELVDAHPDAGCCKPWGESAYVEHGGKVRRRITHLVLESPRVLTEPIPCKGALGLWTPPVDVIERLQAVR